MGFGAVDYLAEVWFNNVRVGEHEGGYLPFEFDVTQAARPGPNTITVRVADPLADFKEVPHGKQSWYGPLSGLWQSVWIERRAARHLCRLRVTPQVAAAQVELEAWLNQAAESSARLVFEVISAEGETAGTVEVIVAAGQKHASAVVTVAALHLWDTDAPYLYTARVTLNRSEEHTSELQSL